MDYRLILGLIFVVMDSSLGYGSYVKEETHPGFHDLHRRQVPDRECIPLRRPSNDYSQLFEFGESFLKLNAGMENAGSASGDVIMFVGNTGTGKSSLVHLLAGNTENFIAEDLESTGNYQIVDLTEKFVSKTITESMTTYPEAIMDAGSGVVLYDTPGFRDTRSAIHELVATYGLQTVAKNSKRIKFALLVNHNSLTATGSRDDFTNALQSYFSLLQNPQKFTTYLVATKVENRYIRKKGQMQLLSDDNFIEGIVKFLSSVKETMRKREKEATTTGKNRKFLSQAQLFIEDLINNQHRILLFRKPEEDGPVMNSATIRQSLATIRQSLLNTTLFVNVDVNDFGYPLTEKAEIYIRELFDLMNNYIVDVSKSFTSAFEQFLGSKLENTKTLVDIISITSSLRETRNFADLLIKSAKASQTPDNIADALWTFVDSSGVDTCGNETLKEIKQLNQFLNNLKDVSNRNLYTPSRWADSLLDIEHIVKDEQDYYAMLNNLFEKLTSHAGLNDEFFAGASLALKKYDSKNIMIDERNFPVLMDHLSLNQFVNLKMRPNRLKTINSIYLKAKLQQAKSRYSFTCRNNTLVIAGNFLQLQTLDKSKVASCEHAKTIALLATNKIYIDTNIGVDILGGRNLVIIAPEWQVVGKFTVSVDGASQGAALPGACNGTVGSNGKPGQSAGKFIGVGLRYFNSEQLTITANGGDGQDGQAGGDGVNGRDGFDGNPEDGQLIDEDKVKTLISSHYERVYLLEGNQGTSGGDAGMGGNGGLGGFKGSVEMHSLSENLPKHRTPEMRNGKYGQKGVNGKPGRGGLRGCDAAVHVTFIHLRLHWDREEDTRDVLECGSKKNPDGKLIPNKTKHPEKPELAPEPPSICELYRIMSGLFLKNNNMFSLKLFNEFQDAFNKKFYCKV